MDYHVKPRKNSFSNTALILGIFSLLSIPTVFLPLPLAALGVLFAVLGHRKGAKWEFPGIAGLVSSAAGLIVSLSLIITSATMFPTLLKTPEYRKQLNAISEQLYGESFDEMVEDIYGIEIDEIFDF